MVLESRYRIAKGYSALPSSNSFPSLSSEDGMLPSGSSWSCFWESFRICCFISKYIFLFPAFIKISVEMESLWGSCSWFCGDITKRLFGDWPLLALLLKFEVRFWVVTLPWVEDVLISISTVPSKPLWGFLVFVQRYFGKSSHPIIHVCCWTLMPSITEFAKPGQVDDKIIQ